MDRDSAMADVIGAIRHSYRYSSQKQIANRAVSPRPCYRNWFTIGLC
jgi:hypothetical protein